MQRSLRGAGGPIPTFIRTETPDPAAAVKLLNILVKFLASDTWAAPRPTRSPRFSLPCCACRIRCGRAAALETALVQ